jgi:hypothetical protein
MKGFIANIPFVILIYIFKLDKQEKELLKIFKN